MTETVTPAQLRRELERKVPESTVVRAGLHTLALRGWFCWRNNVGGMEVEDTDASGEKRERFVAFGFEGLPDITGFTSWGAHVAAEAKRPSGARRLTPPQADHLADVRRAGGVAIVFSSAQELQDAIHLHEVQNVHGKRPSGALGVVQAWGYDERVAALAERVAAVERRFLPRPGEREKYLRAKFQRRAARRKRRSA